MKRVGAPLKPCYTEPRNDDTDQIHDETARQSRWALGIGLTIALIFQVQIQLSKAPTKNRGLRLFGR
jgi:hypothetical protein